MGQGGQAVGRAGGLIARLKTRGGIAGAGWPLAPGLPSASWGGAWRRIAAPRVPSAKQGGGSDATAPVHVQVLSLTVGVGPLVLTDSMPLSRAAALEYISLWPMICPLVAVRLKKGEPLVAVLRW